MATISKGITLSYKADGGSFVELTNLQAIPDLGGEKEKIEITTLADAAHMYCDGILNYGDSLSFTFLYEKEQFSTLNAITDICEWKVALPDGATCQFSGTCSATLVGVGVNEALTYTLSVSPQSEMVWA